MVGATFVTSDVGKAPCICMRRWRGIQYNTIQYNTPQGCIEWHGGYSTITNMSISRRRATATLMKASPRSRPPGENAPRARIGVS